MKSNAVMEKSKLFALRIIKLYRHLIKVKKENVLAKQILRCGTGIGANVREGIRGQSKADFYAKLHISLKEAAETEYWLELLHESDFIETNSFTGIVTDCREIIKLLVAILKTDSRFKKTNSDCGTNS